MTKAKAAPLTSALLSTKGVALPSLFEATVARAPRRATANGSARVSFIPTGTSGGGPKTRAKGRPRKPSKPRGAADTVKASVKLDHETHCRLRVASAHLERSMQDIFVEALKAYLDELAPQVRGGDCHCLAARATQRRG